MWSPLSVTLVRKLEHVQHVFSRLLHYRCMPHSPLPSYSLRLSEFSLTSLYFRRIVSDLVMAFKLLRGFVDIPMSSFYVLRPSNGRLTSFALAIRTFNRVILRDSFSYRTTRFLSKLPQLLLYPFSLAHLRLYLLKRSTLLDELGISISDL